MCAAKSLRKAKSRLPLWGRWTRVSEDGEGKLPAAPSHGLCGSAGGLPSQSPNGDSSPEGGAKSRLPLWGRCHAKGMTERAFPAAPAAHVRYPLDEHERSELPWARIVPRGHAPRIVLRGHAPPKALLQSIEISAILKVHGIPCGSLPRNGTK